MTGPELSTPTAGPATGPAPRPILDSLFGDLWPEPERRRDPGVLARAGAVGLLAAVVLPYRDLGLGWSLVVLAGGAVALAAVRRARRTPYLRGCALLCAALLLPLLLRDAAWISLLCLLAAVGLGVQALVGPRTVAGLAAAGAAYPLAALRGLPWLGRSLAGAPRPDWLPVVRTALVSSALVGVLAALFASADALFAQWVGAVVPDVSLAGTTLRLFVLLGAGGVTLAAAYLGLNPPAVDRLARTPRPVGREFEWVVPVSLVLAVYAAFLAAQATAMFGGHDYLRASTGLTYAEYVHQGFAQLTVATVVTLAVVAAAARRAPRRSSRDRLLVRALLGALCLATLVVVVSALFRLHVYEQAYGFTRLRLLASVFEGWLGVVVLLVVVAGLRLDGRWVPRAAAVSGAAALLALAAVNPDGYIAERNVERYAETGRADWYYLARLSADAVPALRELPPTVQRCVFGPERQPADDWLEWNLGRARAGVATLDASGGCIAR